MPLEQIIINLPNLKIVDMVNGVKILIYAVSTLEISCFYCKSLNLRIKDSFIRKLRHICFGDRVSELHIKSHKYCCLDCGKYFNQRFQGILPRKRATEDFRKQVALKHHDGISQKSLSTRLKLSCSTVEKWYQDFVYLENQKFSGANCPKVLGIDEHFFTKKKGYATTFCDLARNKVFDVTLGRSERALEPFLKRLKGRKNVRVVLMDLSETYRSIVKKYFERALIVADRFHVIRLINHHFLNTWKQLDPNGKYNRGLLSLIRRHHWNLKPEQLVSLQKYLDSVPGLRPVYEFKQQLNQLMVFKTLPKHLCKKYIPIFLQMIADLKCSGFTHLNKLGNTLENWQEEIVRMWRFTKTNSITEGLHNKMEMISRRAFGFRNFENYRLRVRVHCGYAW